MSAASKNKSDASWENLLRLFPGVMFRQNPDLSFAFVSARVEEFTGLSAADWLKQPGERFWQIIHETDGGELKRQLKHAAPSAETVINVFRVRHLVTQRITCVQERRQAFCDENGVLRGFDVVWLDVTQQTMAERQHSSAAWVGASGKLADILVHDFNNLVTGIHAISESFRAQLEAGHAFHEGLDFLQRNAVKAKEVVQSLLDLRSDRAARRKHHNLNDLVTEVLDLTRKLVPRNLQIETTLAPESLPVFGDVGELRRMIIQLVLNGVQAMPQGGRLRLATSRVTAHPPVLHRCGQWPRLPSVCLGVTDTRVGISARLAHEMFDPWSPAKPLWQLPEGGLHDVARIVEQHHGAISVQSEETRGTTVCVWLPEADFGESDDRVARAS